MIKNTIQNTYAFIIGFMIGGVLSVGTDYIFNLQNLASASLLLIIGVIFYRCVYEAIGCFIIARLAGSHNEQLAMAAGYVGLAIGIAGTAASINAGVGPVWYGLAVALLSVPSAFVGVKLYKTGLEKRTRRSTKLQS